MFNVSHSLRILLLFLCYAQWNDIIDRIKNNKNDLSKEEIDCVYADSNYQVERKFSDLMLFIKGGIFGYFTAKQKYDSKESKYKGKGTMKFIFDDLITEIELLDEYVTRINCSDKELFRQKKGLVSNLLKQMEVKTMTDLYRYNQILIQEKLTPMLWFDGRDVKSSRTPNPDSVGVYLDTTLKIEAIDFPFSDLGFSLDDKTMRLVLKIRRGDITNKVSYIYPTIASFTAKATKNESSKITMNDSDIELMIKNIFENDKDVDINFVENISVFYKSYLTNKETSAKIVLETSNSISHFYSVALSNFEEFKNKFNILEDEDIYHKLNQDGRDEFKQKKKLVDDLMNLRTDIRESLLSRMEFFLNHRQKPLDIMGINDATYRLILSQQKRKGNVVFDYLERLSSSSYSDVSGKEVKMDQVDPDIVAAFKAKMDNLEEVGLTRKNPFEDMFDSDEDDEEFDQIENIVPHIGEDILDAVLGSIDEIDENIIQKQDYLTMLSKETKRPYSYFVKTFDNLITFLQGEQDKPLIVMLINHLIWSREMINKDIIDFVVNKTYFKLKEDLVEKRRKAFYLLSIIFLNDLKDKPLTRNSFLGSKIEELKEEKATQADLADRLLEDF